MQTPIEQAIAELVQWIDALDQERDRAMRTLATLQGVALEAPLLLRVRPSRALPAKAAAMLKSGLPVIREVAREA